MDLTVVVKPTAGGQPKFELKLAADANVTDLKEEIAKQSDIPPNEQRLIYKGQVLKDEKLLTDYGYQSEHMVHLVRGRSTNAAASPASGQPAPSAATTNSSAPANPLNIGLPPGTMPSNPQDMSQLMSQMSNHPIMQMMLNNPELLRESLNMNPQIRQLMESNPQIAQMMNDPQMMREAMRIASSPDLMREQMRHADRAMSNMETHPEAYNMLRRMYEGVQEPLMNAVDSSNAAASNPFAALFGAPAAAPGSTVPSNATAARPEAAQPLPNPWAASGGATTQTGQPAVSVGIPPLGGLPNPEAMQSVLSNPAMQQMMQQLMSSPGMMEAVINSNPQLRSMLDANPQVRSMLQDPELLRSLTDPETMSAALQMQEAMQQLSGTPMGRAMGLTNPTAMLGQSGGSDNGAALMASMLGGIGGAGLGAPHSLGDPQATYAAQLLQLQDMGFYDQQENLRALIATGGNVNAAVERLLTNPVL